MSTLDQIVLDTSKVLLFIKSFDSQDREKVGLLLETDEELMTDWAVVSNVCSRFDKRRKWNNEGTSSARPTTTGEVSARQDETRRLLKLIEGPSRGAALDELTKIYFKLKSFIRYKVQTRTIKMYVIVYNI